MNDTETWELLEELFPALYADIEPSDYLVLCWEDGLLHYDEARALYFQAIGLDPA